MIQLGPAAVPSWGQPVIQPGPAGDPAVTSVQIQQCALPDDWSLCRLAVCWDYSEVLMLLTRVQLPADSENQNQNQNQRGGPPAVLGSPTVGIPLTHYLLYIVY